MLFTEDNGVLEMLSPKAKNIIKNNLPFKSDKELLCFFGDGTYLINKNDYYEICINNNTEVNCFDEKFLHEFFHCIQYEEKFPHLNETDKKYNELATELSSFVLDLDVGDRLVTNGYARNSTFDESIIESFRLLEYVKIINDNKTFTSLIDAMGQGGILAHLKYFDDNNDKVEDLITKTKNIRPIIYKYFKIMYKGIKMYSHNSPKDVYKIYKFLLRELNLQNYLSIR